MKNLPNNVMSVVKTRRKLTKALAIETIVRNVGVIHKDLKLIFNAAFTRSIVLRRSI